MDPALKKRLIGASVLILLAIIFLPMLFDGAEPVPSDSVQLDIPMPPERDFETRVVPLDPTPSTGVADAIGVPAAAAAAQADASLTTAPVVVDEPLATVAAPPAARVDAVSGEAVGSAADAGSATAPAPQRPTASVQPATPATAAAAPSARGRFMVNIGSYANAENAARLEASLRATGFAVISDAVSVDGKSARRLRLGPFVSRALAENARIKAKTVRDDIRASVIEIDDTASADVMTSSASPTGASAFAVQVAVLSDVTKANAQRDSLRATGYAAFVEKLNTENGSVYRLRIGPEADRADAEKIRTAVKQRFGYDAIIVDYP